MALTADTINNVSFSIERKGYDVDEVDVFLERVAEEVDAMNSYIAELEGKLAQAGDVAPASADATEDAEGAIVVDRSEEVTELQKRVEELEAQLNEKTANDNAISQALIVAQRSADEIVANARTEATNIVKDADEEADRIIGKAESDRLKIAEAIRSLENDRADVRSEYREMLSNFMADAQRKLAEIDGDSRRAAVAQQARADANAAGYAGVSAMMSEFSAAAPRPSASTPAPASGYVEKDLSGYGDAADDFAFDDID